MLPEVWKTKNPSELTKIFEGRGKNSIDRDSMIGILKKVGLTLQGNEEPRLNKGKLIEKAVGDLCSFTP